MVNYNEDQSENSPLIVSSSAGVQPTPQDFDNEVMAMLKDFVKNSNREDRTLQPNLH